MAPDSEAAGERCVELGQASTELRVAAERLRVVVEQLERLTAERASLQAQYTSLLERVWRAVRAADAADITVPEMVRITGLPRHWLYRRVNSNVPPRVVGRIPDLEGPSDSQVEG
jgi:hypothetical protein